jgi:hypothetical protein
MGMGGGGYSIGRSGDRKTKIAEGKGLWITDKLHAKDWSLARSSVNGTSGIKAF